VTFEHRSVNGFWPNFFNMVGIWVVGTFLDFPFNSKLFERTTRAKTGIVYLLVNTLTILGGGWVFVKDAVRGVSLPHRSMCQLHALHHSNQIILRYLLFGAAPMSYFSYLAIYISYTFEDPGFQAYTNWLTGSFPNN
jgi:hypothetical protein